MTEQNTENKLNIVDNNDIETNDIIDNDPRLPSICIPRVDMCITTEYIEKIMNEVLLDESIIIKTCIERIDLVGRQNEKGEDFKRVFIHFKPWNTFETVVSKNMKQRLLSGETIKVMYNFPSYWKCSASRVPRPQWQDNQISVEKERSKAYIVVDSSGNKHKSDKHTNVNNVKSIHHKKKSTITNLTSKSQTEYKPKWLGESIDIISSNSEDKSNNSINIKKKCKKHPSSQSNENQNQKSK